MNAPSEFYLLRHSLQQVRDRVAAATLSAEIDSQRAGRRPSKLLITASEVNDRQGTGVLLGRIFGRGDTLTLISQTDSRAEGGFMRIQMPDPLYDRAGACALIDSVLREFSIGEVIVVPHFACEVRAALLVCERSGIPAVTWVMDDASLGEARIPQPLLGELLAASAIRFAISPQLADAYQVAFSLPFHVLPPTVSSREIAAFARTGDDQWNGDRRRAFMLGNVWNGQWIEGLGSLLDGGAWSVDWFGPAAHATQQSLPDRIITRGFASENELKGLVPGYPFAILTTGTADERDAMRTLSTWSFPSRLVYLFAVCRLPVLVIGGADSCAASMVREFGIGLHCEYERSAFLSAVETLSEMAFNVRCRARCGELSGSFVSDGLDGWIRESGRIGRPSDGRFQFLEAMRKS